MRESSTHVGSNISGTTETSELNVGGYNLL